MVLLTLVLYAAIVLVVGALVAVVVLLYVNGARPLQPCLAFVDAPALALAALAALFVLHACATACCRRRRRRSRGISRSRILTATLICIPFVYNCKICIPLDVPHCKKCIPLVVPYMHSTRRAPPVY